MAQTTLLYAAPVVVLLYYLGALITSACTLQKGLKYRSKRHHQTIVAFVCLIVVTYLLQSGLLITDSFALIQQASSVAANVRTHTRAR